MLVTVKQFVSLIVVCGVGLAMAGLATASAVRGSGVSLESVSVDLPEADRAFPDGQGVDAVTANCTGCHSANMVLMQPVLSAAAWQEEVSKMRKLYKAPVAAEDVPAIVGYLTAMQASK
jgi:cytochrome c5